MEGVRLKVERSADGSRLTAQGEKKGQRVWSIGQGKGVGPEDLEERPGGLEGK
jgi:hypothetical protein